MTEARVQDVAVDLETARRYLAAAQRMLRDANSGDISAEARFTHMYDAARNAVTAVLRASGKRVTAGSRAHVVTFETARSLLGAGHAAELDRIEKVRRMRRQIEYDTREISSVELEEIREPIRRVVDAAITFVDRVAGDDRS